MRALPLCLLLSLPALAQEAATPAEPSAPPVMSTEATETSSVPSAFLDQAVKVDTAGRITVGRAATPLSARELFERMGRVDLVAKSDSLASRRLWLSLSAGAVAVVGGVVGGVLIGTGPRLASVECESDIRVYNDICVPRAAQHNISGTAVIVTGVATGLLLGTLAFWSDPAVLTRDETASLASSYNAQLARRLKSQPTGLKVVPVVTPDGAAVTASLRF